MNKLLDDFRLIGTKLEWNILKFVIVVLIVYNIGYHIGKFWVNIAY